MAVTKQLLSDSTDGRQIKVVAVATPGITVHVTVTDKDEVWLWAYNSDPMPVELTIEWGDATSPDDTMKFTVPPKDGLFTLIPGLIMTNNRTIRAFAATASVVMVSGYVNRIT